MRAAPSYAGLPFSLSSSLRVYSSSSAFPDRLFNVSPFYACPLPSKIGERFCDKLGGKADSGEVVKARNSFGEEGIGTLLSAPVLSAKDSVGLSKLVGVFVLLLTDDECCGSHRGTPSSGMPWCQMDIEELVCL